MDADRAVKLFASPVLIGLASLAGRRWGHNAAGVIGGLPLVGGPIVLALWMSEGPELARRVALAAPVGIWATIVYLLTVGYLSAFASWFLAIPIAWACYLATEWLLHAAGVTYSLALGLAVLPGLYLAANHWLPKPKAHAQAAPLPAIELIARMIAAVGVVLALTSASGRIGAEYTGMLAAAPVAASVIPAFTLANSGRDACLLALRGFLTGLIGFAVFFFVLGHTMDLVGAWSLAPAAIAALLAGFGAMKLVRGAKMSAEEI